MFRQKTGLAMTHVPYKGSGPATIDLLAGRIDLFFATVPTILQHVQDGKLPVLAVTGARRSPLFPDVPTMAEAGVPGFEVTTWWACSHLRARRRPSSRRSPASSTKPPRASRSGPGSSTKAPTRCA